MNSAVNTLFAEYLEHTGGDKAAAASLVLAAVLRDAPPAARAEPLRDAQAVPTVQPVTGRPMTVPEVARFLRVQRDKVLNWVRSGELRGWDSTAKPGSRRPKYRINLEDLEAFIRIRAIVPPTPVGRPAGRRQLPEISRPRLDTAKRGRNSSPPTADHR